MFILHGQIGPATISFALIVGDKPQGPFLKFLYKSHSLSPNKDK